MKERSTEEEMKMKEKKQIGRNERGETGERNKNESESKEE